jgi:Leucine-rich repeat (LRR) protein
MKEPVARAPGESAAMPVLSSSIFVRLCGKTPLQEGEGMDPWEAEQDLFTLHQRSPDLKALDLSYRALTEVPFGLAEFQMLETLNLSHNQLIDLGGALLNLKALRTLDVSDNWLVEVPRVIPLLSNLEALDLSGNRLTAVAIEMIVLPRLRTLKLCGNPLTLDKVPEPLRALTVL